MRNNPEVALAPCTALGKPTGPAKHMIARRLQHAQARHAARLLARKYPVLQLILVPSLHRLARAKYGRTAHFELTPVLEPAEAAWRAHPESTGSAPVRGDHLPGAPGQPGHEYPDM